jgi:hypothetical protein
LNALLLLPDATSGLVLLEPVELLLIASSRRSFLVGAGLVGEGEGLLIVAVCVVGEVQLGCEGASENSKASWCCCGTAEMTGA